MSAQQTVTQSKNERLQRLLELAQKRNLDPPAEWYNVAKQIGGAGRFLAKFIGHVFDAIFGDVVEGVVMWGRTEFTHYTGILKGIFQNAFQTYCNCQPHVVSGVSADGLYEIFRATCVATAQMSAILDPEIAEELFTEMVQEAYSNAIQYNLGGAVQTILNVYRGGYPLNPDEVQNVIDIMDNIDEHTLVFLLAEAGNNLPSLAFYIARALEEWKQTEYSTVHDQLLALQEEINDTALLFHRQLRNLCSRYIIEGVELLDVMYLKLLDIYIHVAERSLVRLNELLAELETVNSYYNNNLIDLTSAQEIALVIEQEVYGVRDAYQNMRDFIFQQIDQLDIDPSELYNEIKECLRIYAITLANARTPLQKVEDEIKSKVTRIYEIYKKVSIYRTAVDSNARIDVPVKIEPVVTGAYGVTAEVKTAPYMIKEVAITKSESTVYHEIQTS